MYIEMKPPFKFHCFKCETSGALNLNTMRDLGIFDSEFSTAVISANKTVKADSAVRITHIRKEKIFNLDDSEISQRNVNYFNNRYKTNFTNEYISNKFKVITNPPKWFKDNNVFVPYGQYDFNNAIGFLSADNSHVVFRDTSGKQEKRYYNLNLEADNDITTASKIYNIRSTLDIMQEKTTLVITEGIFDIIGVYSHFYKDTPAEENTIFAAACGKAYNAVINHFVQMGFIDLDVIIYSDGDVEDNFYRNLKKSSIYIERSPLTVYYNSLYNKDTGFGKDYGVPKEQIKLRKMII